MECSRNGLKWLKSFNKTLPEAQRTQGIDSITWIILSANSKLISVVLLELVISLATRWQHLITYWLIHWWYLHQIQTLSLGGIIFINWTTTCIRSKFGHQIAAICISLEYRFYDLFLAVYDQITNIMICWKLVQNLVNGWRLLHWFQSWPLDWVTFIATLPWIAILALSACIELVAWSARVTSVKLAQRLLETDIGTHRSDPRTPGSEKELFWEVGKLQWRKWEGSQPRLRCAGGKWLFQRRKMGVFLVCALSFLWPFLSCYQRPKGISEMQNIPAKLTILWKACQGWTQS